MGSRDSLPALNLPLDGRDRGTEEAALAIRELVLAADSSLQGQELPVDLARRATGGRIEYMVLKGELVSSTGASRTFLRFAIFLKPTPQMQRKNCFWFLCV